jgi:hypothetical protein
MCETCTVRYELFIPVEVDVSDDPFYVIYFMLAWLEYHLLCWHPSYHRLHV